MQIHVQCHGNLRDNGFFSPMSISSVEDLRSILSVERAQGDRGQLGGKARAVLTDMLNRPGPAAVDSISELAAKNGVDPSTLTRLGKKLGFAGFAELQDIFRRHVAQTQAFYSTRVQERVAEPLVIDDPRDLIRVHAQSECQRVLDIADALDVHAITHAVDAVVAAKRVCVLAMRATYALSYFLGTYLGTLRENVIILGGPGQALTSDLASLTPDDLLVAVTFRPYTRAVITAVEVMKENSVPILAITDANSALSVGREHGTTVVIDEPFYFDSATSQFFVIQTILLAAARRIGPAAVDMTKRRERLDKALNVEIS
ncbi:MurR/RpiR family transcriptional regulator [Ottowia sp. GY511]|uniref:MurR/RpiR family transcriptional regulator n=1 Tax=Ottowia flava TaxID=2675430 RepID=A0ABW4KYS6_9BURK|nr:MurR/RpiR family transcriptional regulator [Ottowia sp. GY511]TXK31460.1 MurR/RpiR family transcriptional regulator [Ottowia sp. GY511]